MIAIVDYGAGNLRSVENMLRRIGHTAKITSSRQDIAAADKIILPGVGHFDFGMTSLAKRDMIDTLNYKVLEEKIPILGICLGAQLLTRSSEEGRISGLGWIDADARQFDTSRLHDSLRVPHMGWADTEYSAMSTLFSGSVDTPRFYYVHSYHIVCDNESDELCHATHGYRFVAGIQKENILGVQFHPEKSHRFGKQILANFANI